MALSRQTAITEFITAFRPVIVFDNTGVGKSLVVSIDVSNIQLS
jgi:hypothetical protein